MDPFVPSSDDPDQGLDYDVGVSLQEWATRWSELEEARADDQSEALHGAVDLLDAMYAELGVPGGGGDDPGTEELPRDLAEVRDVDRRLQVQGPVTAEELDDAWHTARDVYDYLMSGRDVPDAEV